MAKPKIRWRIKGFEEIRRSEAMADALLSVGDQMMEHLAPMSSGYMMDGGQAKSRFRVGVFTSDADSIRDNAKNNSLLLALGAVSGMQIYTTKAGKMRLATDAQVLNWTRGGTRDD